MTAPADPVASGHCALDGCRLADDGACALGFADPFECENFEPEETEGAAGTDLERDGIVGHGDVGEPPTDPPVDGPLLDVRGRRPWQPSDDVVALHTGEALTAAEATRIRQGHPCSVVVPVGSVDVGKTTLLAAVYEALACGPVDGWSFAGSRSLIGWEARSFLATRASGRIQPDTPRTSRDTNQLLLHVALRAPDGASRHLLLADVSGEHAETLRRYDEPGVYAPLLRAATCICLMVDGARLAEPGQRHAAISEAQTTFRAMQESQLMATRLPVIVIVTKWDLCRDADVDLNGLLEAVRQTGRPTTLLRLSARPRTQEGAAGSDSVGTLLQLIVDLPPRRAALPPTRPEPARTAHGFKPGSALAGKYAWGKK